VIRVIAFLMLVALILVPSAGLSVEASYDCVHTGHTNIGWSGREGKYTAEAMPQVSKSSIVKLSGLNTERPLLTGQAVTRLQRLADDGATTWFAEQAPAGTIILWTFFSQSKGPRSSLRGSSQHEDVRFYGTGQFHRSVRLQAEFASGRKAMKRQWR
jgi:hypothetical protein